MDVRLQIQTTNFNAAMSSMQRKLSSYGITQSRIINFEVGKIMDSAISKTKAATKTSIRRNFNAKEWTTYNGKKYPLKGPITTQGKNPHTSATGFRYPNALWRGIVSKRTANLNRRFAAIGLAKQTWAIIAGRIGYKVTAPGYVFSARAPTKKNEANISVRTTAAGTSYGVEIVNASPLMQFANGRQALFAAVVGRRKFFERNAAKGVFDELQSVARAYPGLVMKTEIAA